MLLTPALSLSSGYGQAARLLRPQLVDPGLSPPASEAVTQTPIKSPAAVVDGLPLDDSTRDDVLAAIGTGGGGYAVASHLRRILGDQPPGLVREAVSRANRLAAHVRANTPRAPIPARGAAVALGLRKSGVIKIGAHGGQIIGFAHGDPKRPIYADKSPHLTHAHVYPSGSGSGGQAVDVPVHDAHGPYAWTDHASIAGGKPAVVHLLTGRVVKAVVPAAGGKGPKATASNAVKLLAVQHGQVGLDAPAGGFVSKADYQAMRSVVEGAEAGAVAPKPAPVEAAPPAAPPKTKLTPAVFGGIAAWATKTAAAGGSGGKIAAEGPGGKSALIQHLGGPHWLYTDTAGKTINMLTAGVPTVLVAWKNLGYATVEVHQGGNSPGKGTGSTPTVQHTANPIANAFLTEVDKLIGGNAEPLAPGTLEHLQKIKAAAKPTVKPDGNGAQPASGPHQPIDSQTAKGIADKVSWALNMPYEQVRAALTATDAGPGNAHIAQARARIEGAILKLGLGRPNAVLELLDGGHHTQAQVDARIEAIGSGDKALLKKEYAATPDYDLQVLKSAKAEAKYNPNGAYCTHDREVVMGKGEDGKYVTGNFRHELGHAVMMSWGYHNQPSAPAGTPAVAIVAHYAAAKAKVAKAGKPPPGGFSHEWYEVNAGVIGSRALDNAHEDAAEHYRGYHREVLRHRFKKGGQLDTYRARHPEMAAVWDARYTAALLASAASKGIW